MWTVGPPLVQGAVFLGTEGQMAPVWGAGYLALGKGDGPHVCAHLILLCPEDTGRGQTQRGEAVEQGCVPGNGPVGWWVQEQREGLRAAGGLSGPQFFGRIETPLPAPAQTCGRGLILEDTGLILGADQRLDKGGQVSAETKAAFQGP